MEPTLLEAPIPRVIAWSWQTQPGLDVAAVTRTPSAIVVQGRMQVVWEDGPLQLAYRLECGPDWSFSRVEACAVHRGQARSLRLTFDGSQWGDDEGQRPDLSEASYIDIMATPITNTLPLCHAAWQVNRQREFTMAYIRLPELTVEAVRQRYTCLSIAPDGSRRFRYETLGPVHGGTTTAPASGYHSQGAQFTADIEVDPAGLVVSYPPYWKRMEAGESLLAAVKE